MKKLSDKLFSLKVKRPIIITIITISYLLFYCMVFLGILIVNFFSVHDYANYIANKEIGSNLYGMPLYISNLFFSAWAITASVGLLKMKKWAFYALLVLAVLYELEFLYYQKSYHGLDFYITLITALVGFKYRKQLT